MTAALEGGEWSAARPGRTLPPGKNRYPFYRRLGRPQGRSRREENLVPTGIRSRTFQPAVSPYTVWATHTNTHKMACVFYFSAFFQHMVCDGVAIAAFGNIYFLSTIPGNPRVSNSQTSSVSFLQPYLARLEFHAIYQAVTSLFYSALLLLWIYGVYCSLIFWYK